MLLTAFIVPHTCSADVPHSPSIELLISPVQSLNERLQNRGKIFSTVTWKSFL